MCEIVWRVVRSCGMLWHLVRVAVCASRLGVPNRRPELASRTGVPNWRPELGGPSASRIGGGSKMGGSSASRMSYLLRCRFGGGGGVRMRVPTWRPELASRIGVPIWRPELGVWIGVPNEGWYARPDLGGYESRGVVASRIGGGMCSV